MISLLKYYHNSTSHKINIAFSVAAAVSRGCPKKFNADIFFIFLATPITFTGRRTIEGQFLSTKYWVEWGTPHPSLFPSLKNTFYSLYLSFFLCRVKKWTWKEEIKSFVKRMKNWPVISCALTENKWSNSYLTEVT